MKHILAAQSRRITLVVLSALGCAVVWLSHQAHTNIQGLAAQFCGQLGGGCDRAFNHAWAVLPPGSNSAAGELSMPMTIVGMWHFGFLLLWFFLVGVPTYGRRWWHLVPLIEVTAAMAMVVLLVRVIVNQELWCIYCIASHVITLLLGFGILTSWPRKQADGVESTPRPANRVAICALVFGFVLAFILFLSANPHMNQTEIQKQVSKLIAEHFEQTPVDVTVENSDAIQPATSGSNHHTLIVFFDVQCPPCKQFLAYIEETILPVFDGRLTVVYKHYPMSSRCNPVFPDIHPHACEAAHMVEAARQQDGIDAFLEMAKLAYEHKSRFDRFSVRFLAKEANLDADQFEIGFKDDEVANRVKRHIELGVALNIEGTPTAFMDGVEIDRRLLAAMTFWEAVADR